MKSLEHCTISNVTAFDMIANMYVACKVEILQSYWTHIYWVELYS